jgi:putative DNA primase/helicase
MYSKVTKGDPKFITNVTTKAAMEYLLSHVIKAYIEMYDTCEFTTSKIVVDFNKEYHDENNNVSIYVRDLSLEDVKGKRSKEAHTDYVDWAEENGLHPVSARSFNEEILKQLRCKVAVVKQAGKSARCFVELEE